MATELSTPLDRARDLRPAPTPGATQGVLDRVFADGAALGLGTGFATLWSELAEATRGGKRFRPELFATTYRAWGGTDPESAAAVGAAIELLHTALIVHDDVIDEDDVRRGRPTVAGAHTRAARDAGAHEQQAGQYGVTAGILAGDLALATSLKVVATCPARRATVDRLLELFHDVLMATVAGELADVWLSVQSEPALLEDVLTMEERKTAVYSFALPLQAAAVLAGAAPAEVDAAGRVGRALGVAFQLADDLAGVFGDPALTGKSALSDLRAGKRTPLVAHASTTSRWPAIAAYVGSPTLSEAEAQHVRSVLVACGSRRFVQDLADDYASAAVDIAVSAGLPPAIVETVRSFGEDLIGRAA